MRIVHLLHAFHTGGMEKGVATVVRNSSPEFDHVVLCADRSGDSRRLLPETTTVRELGKRPGNSPLFLWKLSRELRSLRPDVIHTRNWGGMDGILAARMAGIRHVVHGEHGWTMEDPDGRSRRRERLRRALSRWVTEYTCVSKQMERWLGHVIRGRRRITQIYNGVDPSVYCPGTDRAAVRRALGVSGKAFVVGITARLDPIKNHAVLFRAVEALRATHPETVLVVIGDGPERDRLEKLASSATFLGNRQDVPDLLRAFDVFVLPSLNEGISNTILEAMASALPVVASNVGGNPELVDHEVTGIVVPVNDSAAIEAALGRYARDAELRRSHGQAGRGKAMREFAITSMVARYEDVWRRVAGTVGPRRAGSHRASQAATLGGPR